MKPRTRKPRTRVKELTGKSSPERIWKEFWAPIIAPKGRINERQLKKELADFYFLIREVPKVYSHVTGGLLSKLNYDAETVNEAADRHTEQKISDAQEEWNEEQL